jgi:hypothetical protein
VIKKTLTCLTAAAISLAAPATAHAGGIPVIDPSNIAQSIKAVQNGLQQLQQAKAQVEQLSNLTDTIGAVGEGEISSILERSGLDLSTKNDTLFSQFNQTLPGILDALPNSSLGKELGVDASSAQQARTSIDAGRRFALSTFYKGENASVDDVTRRQAIREAAMRDSATAGFATAVVTKARLGEAQATIDALTDQMGKSADLRTDVQNNSAVNMATLQQIVIQNQLLAQLLEVQATGNMGNSTAGNN